MTVEVRRCAAGELPVFLSTCFAAFGGALDDDGIARVAPAFETERLFVALDGAEPVGTAGTHGFELSVPGGAVPCGGVTMVGVLPWRRRQGIFRRLMERVLEDARGRGEALSVLWSTEGDLYGRFGYGLATFAARIDVARDRAAMRSAQGAPASIRPVELDEAVATFAPVYDAVRAATPGMPSRSDAWWRSWRLPGPPGTSAEPPIFRVLLEIDGRPEAYALYRMYGSWDVGVSTARLEVLEAMASTPVGTEGIWRFLLSLDLVERVRALHLPVDHPLPLLVRAPARLRTTLTDGLWVRIVDAAAALASRTYAGEGEVVLEVADPLCPWNAGRRRLCVDAVGVSFEPTTGPAEIRLPVVELGAAYLGGVSFERLARAGRVEELRPGAVQRLDALFRPGRAPWCPEEF